MIPIDGVVTYFVTTRPTNEEIQKMEDLFNSRYVTDKKIGELWHLTMQTYSIESNERGVKTSIQTLISTRGN